MEEDQIKNWEFQQTKMNKSLNELIQNLNYGKSPNSKNNSSSGPRELELTNLETDTEVKNNSQNSSATEFKRYLEDLKRSYLEKLAFSCPPKINKNLSTFNSDSNAEIYVDNGNKLKSVENLSNLLKKKNELSTMETSSARRALFNEKLKSEEETLEKKTSIAEQNAEPELSNTQILSRLVQIREYLKQAYSMLTTLQTSKNQINYSAQMSKLHSLIDHLKEQEKGYMDLLNSLSKFQEMNQNIFCDAKETNENKKLSMNNSFTNESELGSICGSFISDTITLNNGINEIMDKYRKSMIKVPDDSNELVVVGKSYLNKSMENEEDERTENDQDALEFDDDYLSNLVKNAKRTQMDNEQKEEAIKQMNIDLDTLEQLREQKQLLKSIRLRKEELKALEGRRKALEALKKIATDGEDQVNDAFRILPITDQSEPEEPIDPNSICINRGVQTEAFTPRKPMIRKTVKSKEPSHSEENIDCVNIEPSSQIEKSKITAKHYEDLIRQILTEKYSDNLIKAVSTSDMEVQEPSDNFRGNFDLTSKENDTETDAQEELKIKLKDLAEHEKKLDELYKMQTKLANLKTFMNEFEEMKKSDGNCEIDEEEGDQETEEEELRKENAAKKELIEIHKQKLLNAKEKLKDLQSLISRLQVISDETGIEADFSIPEDRIDTQTLDYMKNVEIQQKEERLEELNRNKQKLLELLKKKEQETKALDKNILLKNENSGQDVSYLNEIESKFKAAENGFDLLSVENLRDEGESCHSPSDLLWSKMKKQLAMRENLRNQKSELEECIRDEYNKQESDQRQIVASKTEDGNEILSAYRGFLMRGTELERNLESEQDKESGRCEQLDRKKSESESTVSEWGDDDDDDENDGQSEISQPKQPSNTHFDQLSDKLESVLANQQKINEQILNKFNELFEKKSLDQLNQSNSSQFQTQLHIQQLMFNLNTAYHEISTQRTEISRLNDQMLSVNKQLAELTRAKNTSNSVGVNTEEEEKTEPNKTSKVVALPSYFYNRKKDNTNVEKNYYTDDFEELDEDEERKYCRDVRTESSLSSTSNARSSMTSSTLSLRKSLMKHRTSQNSTMYKSLTFEKMREQIYSEVASLISQNESRPFYLLNLFKELQFIKDKNARDQTLKSIFNISNRQSNLKLSYMKKNYPNMDEEKAYTSKKYESDRQNEADEESTPFESDSLSNTVIFVKNSPKSKVDQKESNSSGSSIMGVEEEADKQNIGAEVKSLISKIILCVKSSDNFDSDEEDSSSGSSERSKTKKTIFDSNYLNEIIEKVHQVLSESPKHSDYLNYYSAQLTCYLKEALAKYENKFLTDCMEDVLIEISDILYNELTFYTTLKTNKKNNNFSNSSSSLDSSNAEFSDRIEQTEQNFNKCKYQSIELLKQLSSILNNKFGDLKTMKDKLMDDRLALEKDKLESLKFELKKEFENLNLMTDLESMKEKYASSAAKYVDASEPDSSVCGEDNFQSFETDSEKGLPYRVVDADELKDETITIDDLPVSKEENLHQTENAMPGLDKIIMQTICDQLVGNPDEIMKIDENTHQKTKEENGSLKSDSSNSDHFVIISDSKKENEETDKIDEKCNDSEEIKQDNGSLNDKN